VKKLRILENEPKSTNKLAPLPRNEFTLCDSTIDFIYLLRLIELKGFGLTHIFLKNVTLINFDTINICPRAILPNLEQFKYIQDKKDDQSLQPDKNHPYYKNTKMFLFFEKNSTGVYWLFNGLFNLGVEIQVRINGINLLNVYPEENEKKLVLSFPLSREISDAIIQSSSTVQVKILALCGVEMHENTMADEFEDLGK
jgi:hypothetical protein